MASKNRGTAPRFPTRDQILEFIKDSDRPVGKREIARAFNLKSTDKVRLRDLLRDLKTEGVLPKGKRHRPEGSLPEVTVLEVTSLTSDGDVMARPVSWTSADPPPTVRLLPERGRPPGIGDRVLARLSRQSSRTYTARTIKRLESGPDRVLGIFQPRTGDGNGQLIPTNRRVRYDVAIPPGMENGAEPNELVEAEIIPGKPLGPRLARIVETYGPATGPRSVSLICIHSHDIPFEFPDAVLKEAEAIKPATADRRADLRDLPLITIDGADARDFDDAVWAAPDDAKDNAGGWQIVVAIADVAWYVRPGKPLDQEALKRGNSVYFPDRVVPMLPERLSNDLCSLKPDEDRACVAAHMRIDAQGKLIGHRFERAIMRSAARLTYDQVQAARDGAPDDQTAPLRTPVIDPLYGAFDALAAARAARETLELDLPERKIELNDNGDVVAIRQAPRFDSHRLIEEFMIAANVAAAETLERRKVPCMYRVHEAPDVAGLETLKTALRDLGVGLPASGIRPADLNYILTKTSALPQARMIHELVLRAQSQAIYSPENKGHFGLALPRYAHFTSPIRRYADLLVHRALVGGKEDGLPAGSEGAMRDWGETISKTERRAMAAEREASDRFMAAFMKDKVGGDFSATVAGITRAGLFVTLSETGASGLIPMSLLPNDYYRFDEKRRRLVGDKTGQVWRIGDPLDVRLREATPVTGGLLFEVLGGRASRSGKNKAKSKTKRKRNRH